MIRTTILGLALALFACDKPTSEDCEKALHNMQQLLGTDSLNNASGIQGEIRRCRGGSSKEAVACAIKAQTIDDLNKCDFEKTGKHGPLGGSASGSAAMAPAAGSAAPAGSGS